jgi:hypothetical protein
MRCFPFRTKIVGLVLCCATLQLTTPAGVAQSAPAPSKLFIQVLEGEGALNDVRSRTTREPIVQVQDENHKPIAGALVIFTTPSSGPSANFANGAIRLRTVTDAEGKAIATGFKPNGIAGSYQIHVQAVVNHVTAEMDINQSNTNSSSSSSSTQAVAHAGRAFPLKAVLIVAAVAAAGATAGILATRGGSGTTITAGAPTVGAPATPGFRISFGSRR